METVEIHKLSMYVCMSLRPTKNVKFKSIHSHSQFVSVNSAMRHFRIRVWPKKLLNAILRVQHLIFESVRIRKIKNLHAMLNNAKDFAFFLMLFNVIA